MTECQADVTPLMPAQNFRMQCGCDVRQQRLWERNNRHIYASYDTPIRDRGLSVTTWWQRIDADEDVATVISRAVDAPCRQCGQLYFAPMTDADIVWERAYPSDRVTVAGLGEAHEYVVAQVRAGRLP